MSTWSRVRRALVLCTLLSATACPPPSYVNFETIPTRAVALSPDGRRLFVTNTPDSRLEIFNVSAQGLTHSGSVQVGLDPVAVAARTSTEVWVVNHLSDSVSVVDLSGPAPFVARTLLVGDEPRDVVFAGRRDASGGFQRAFISAARRGQNHPKNTPQTPVPERVFAEQRRGGIGRADVWVFNTANLTSGQPETIVTMFGDKPGALEATPDGSRVFVSIATSGNETSIINAALVCTSPANGRDGRDQLSLELDTTPAPPRRLPCQGGVPAPNMNQVDGGLSPRTGLIVKFNRTDNTWRDVAGRNQTTAVPFTLPDNDVFTLNALATPPVQSGVFQHTGTLNEGIAIHPTNGRAYLATIEAINMNRFISLPGSGLGPNPDRVGGAALSADPKTGKTLNGHLYESRIAVLNPANGSVAVRHLNPHINYEMVPTDPSTRTKERSVASPRGGVFSADGSTLFVVAMGSNQIVPFRTADLDAGTIVPDASQHIQLSGIGPTSAVLDAARNRLYVYTRLDNAVEVVDLGSRREVGRLALPNPESPGIQQGRRFFYDSTITSSNGEASCAVCHPSGDKDDLAWDLGAPFLGTSPITNPLLVGGPGATFNPLKGPMTVLTLRGFGDGGPMFWRGDATNATNFRDFLANFQNFNIVYPALLGREAPLADEDFQQLSLWASTVTPPPNPHRNLDNELTDDQQTGSNIFLNRVTDIVFPCVGCHKLDPSKGFFGTGGEMTIEGETQTFKVVQLRTTYDKVGMFLQSGPQVRGFGTLHDGSAAGPEFFIRNGPFMPLTPQERDQIADFIFVFPGEYAPIVGQQITLRADNAAAANARIGMMIQRAMTPFVLQFTNENVKECELVVKFRIGNEERGFLMQPDGKFMGDKGELFSDLELRSVSGFGIPLTYTCVYPGGGQRLALDRNSNGMLDGLE